jgi:hypothetical protein
LRAGADAQCSAGRREKRVIMILIPNDGLKQRSERHPLLPGRVFERRLSRARY